MNSRAGAAVVISPYALEYGPARVLEHAVAAALRSDLEPICVVPPRARIATSGPTAEAERHVLPDLSTFPRTLNPVRMGEFFRRHTRAAREIEEIVKAHRAAVVYSTSEAILCGGMAARAAGVPSIAHVIGMSIGSPGWAGELYIPLLSSQTDHFIACSSAVAEMLEHHGVDEERITVVHHGVPVAEIAGLAADPVDLGPGPHIGMVAAYDPRKGHDLFVEAAARIAPRHPDARFYVIGGTIEGNAESAAFERRIASLVRQHGLEDRFVRTGYLTEQSDVYRWIGALDVLVVPSQTEAFSLVLLESMAASRPIVATRIEGNVDALVHRQSGLYVPRDAREMAEAVSALIDDRELAASMGRAARVRAETFFGVEQTLSATRAVIDELADVSRDGAPRPSPLDAVAPPT